MGKRGRSTAQQETVGGVDIVNFEVDWDIVGGSFVVGKGLILMEIAN